MKTSIIIPHWNTLNYLKDCIESIVKNTEDYEIIVVDNGSTEEGVKEFIEQFADKHIFNEKNMGFSKANNQGAKIAEGEYLCFLNSDTIVGKDWLVNLHKTLNIKNCGASGPLGNPKSGCIDGRTITYSQYVGQYNKDTMVGVLIGFCILMKNDLFNDIGCWDEDFLIGNFEDNYLCYRINQKGYDLWISAKSDVKHLKPGRTFESNKINWLETLKHNRELINKR